MHKMELFAAVFEYIEDLFTMKLTEKQKVAIKDAFDKIHVSDGIERTIRAIEAGLHIKIPQELFMETRGHSSVEKIETLLKRVNFEASMWTQEYHQGLYSEAN